MKIDLHCHTTASDGTLSPEQLIDLAVEREITTLAITDHDTTAGYEQVRDYAQQQDLQLIVGSEVSCQWRGQTIHIVGLDFDIDHPKLQAGLKHNRVKRWQRARQMDEKCQALKLEGVLDEMMPLQEDDMIGRNHFAEVLIRRKKVKNQQQAFDKFLKKGRPLYVEVDWPSLQEVVGWIKAAGGIAVIAHPRQYKMTSNKLNKMIADFIEAGGQALEVVNQPRANSDQIGMADRAVRFGLYASVGSDFHRPEHTWRGLGWLAPLPYKCQPVWQLFKTPVVG